MCHRKKCCTIVLYEHEIIICVRTRQDSIEFDQNLIEINCVCVECASDGGTVQILQPEQKSTGGANIGGE